MRWCYFFKILLNLRLSNIWSLVLSWFFLMKRRLRTRISHPINWFLIRQVHCWQFSVHSWFCKLLSLFWIRRFLIANLSLFFIFILFHATGSVFSVDINGLLRTTSITHTILPFHPLTPTRHTWIPIAFITYHNMPTGTLILTLIKISFNFWRPFWAFGVWLFVLREKRIPLSISSINWFFVVQWFSRLRYNLFKDLLFISLCTLFL